MPEPEIVEAAPPKSSLVELIDRLIPIGDTLGPNTAKMVADVRDAALALQTEIEDGGARAEDFLNLHAEMQSLSDNFDQESREADLYARRMHAAHEVVRIAWELLIKKGVDLTADLTTEEMTKVHDVLMQVLPAKGSPEAAANADRLKSKTFITKETAPLVALEA